MLSFFNLPGAEAPGNLLHTPLPGSGGQCVVEIPGASSGPSQALQSLAQCPPKLLLNYVPFSGSWEDIHWPSPSPPSLSLPRGTQGSHVRREMIIRGKLMSFWHLQIF